MTCRVAIVTDEPGWHGARLREAFAARGADARYVSLGHCRIELGSEQRILVPGFGDDLPDAVFVRGIPGGTLEQVVYHLNVLHALGELGVPVYNSGRAIERSVDKSLTSLRLSRAGLPTPRTWVTAKADEAVAIADACLGSGQRLLCKPLFGSEGKGIRLLERADQLPGGDAVNGVWYLQHFVGEPGQGATDWRVFVVAGTALAAMRRSAPGWLANVAQGGECQAVLADGELRRLAERAVACLQMDYAGVDLMRDAQGRWWVIEVNSVPAWKGLQAVCQTDIAACLAKDLLGRCGSEAQRASAP